MRDAPVTDPVTRVVVASGRLRSVHTGCQVASYSFPRRAVAIVILEWHGTYGGTRFAPRPSRFTARNLPLLPAPAIECFNGRGGSIQFTDGGRRFGAYLLLGIDAPRPLAAKARAVLDTLRVRART
jgi:hypothetical protein